MTIIRSRICDTNSFIRNKIINKLTSIMWFIGKTAANPMLLIRTNQENPKSTADCFILTTSIAFFWNQLKVTNMMKSLLKYETERFYYI